MVSDRPVQVDPKNRRERETKDQVVGCCLAYFRQVFVKFVGQKDVVCGLGLAEWSCCVLNRSDEAGV